MKVTAKLDFDTYKTEDKEYQTIYTTLKDKSRSSNLSSWYDKTENEFIKELKNNGYDVDRIGCPEETKDYYIDGINIELIRGDITESKKNIKNIWNDVKKKILN